MQVMKTIMFLTTYEIQLRFKAANPCWVEHVV